MKTRSTKPARKPKSTPLQRVTATPRAIRACGRLDDLIRRTLRNRYHPQRCTWEQVGARYGLSRGRVYQIAHGQRPIPPALRQRFRAELSPRKLRKFIRTIAVPFLIRNWRG